MKHVILAAIKRVGNRQIFEDGLSADLHEHRIDTKEEAFMLGRVDALREVREELEATIGKMLAQRQKMEAVEVFPAGTEALLGQALGPLESCMDGPGRPEAITNAEVIIGQILANRSCMPRSLANKIERIHSLCVQVLARQGDNTAAAIRTIIESEE